MNEKHTKYLSALENKVITFSKTYNVRMGALLVHRNKIISYGKNDFKTDPFQAKYADHEWRVHIHAEVNAVKKALKQISIDEIKDSTLYVVRMKQNPFDKKFIWGMARPCKSCQMCLAAFGISKVVYTTEDGCAFL